MKELRPYYVLGYFDLSLGKYLYYTHPNNYSSDVQSAKRFTFYDTAFAFRKHKFPKIIIRFQITTY